MERITVLLAEDHVLVREGLRVLLESSANFEVVGEATTGRQAVELVRKLRPAVVVMDIAMPQLNGFEATRQIMQAAPETKVLVLSAHSDEEYVEHMAAVGACGYLVKQTSGRTLVTAINEIARGRPYFGSSTSRRLLEVARESRASGGRRVRAKNPLTAREAEVLQLIAEGAANKQIAAELGIGSKTVEKHRQHLMDKLGIHDTAGLTRYAIATGVIESEIPTPIGGPRPGR